VEDDFYNVKNKVLYTEILQHFLRNGNVDISSINSCDMEYVVNSANIALPSNVKTYAKKIKEASLRRKLIRACQETIEFAKDGEGEIAQIKAKAMGEISSVIIPDNEKSSGILDVLKDTVDDLKLRREKRHSTCPKWGFAFLDKFIGGIKPSITILAARPGVGKTTFATNILCHVAEQGKKVALFSLEMPKQQISEKILCSYGQLNKDKIDNPWDIDEKSFDTIMNVADGLSKLSIRIFDDKFYLEDMRLKCQELKSLEGLDLVIIDYIQLMETYRKCNNTVDRISHITRDLKKLQMELNIPLIILSQLNREGVGEPQLQHLRDSGSIEQDADNVLFLWLEKEEESFGSTTSIVNLKIDKQRNGKKGKTVLKFYGASQRFYDN
jgi:replicative DNA helicase